MIKKVSLLLISFLFVLAMTSCGEKPSEVNDYLQYKGSMVGDNTAVINIVSMLIYGQYLDKIELQTDKEPYGIIVNYDFNGADEKKITFEDHMTANALVMFYLIDNVDTITFKDVDNFMDECTFDRETEMTKPEHQQSLLNFENGSNEQIEAFITDGSYKWKGKDK